MTPAEWARSKHGRMLFAALDTQVLRVIAKHHRVGLGVSQLMPATKLVMEEQLRVHGKPTPMPGSLQRLGKVFDRPGSTTKPFVKEMTTHIHRLCKTWLTGKVTTVDQSVVDWRQVDHVFRTWRMRTTLKLRENEGILRRMDLSSWSPR